MKLALQTLAVMCLVASAAAHALWIYPSPRHDGDNMLKAYPCGSGNQYNDLDGAATTLSVGSNYVSFRETINHSGAPYRIALTYGGTDDEYDSHVLLDHIGHNQQGATNENGGMGKFHVVEIQMPDINCDAAAKCAIQVIQVMTDKFPNGDNCEPNELPDSCGSLSYVYFSCSHPILVNGATAPAAIGTLYTDYINPGNNAPRAYLEAGENSDWTQDCGTYWRLDGQGPVDPAWCANPPTSPPQPTTTAPPTTTPGPTTSTTPGPQGSNDNNSPTIAASSTQVAHAVVVVLAALALAFA